MAKKHSYTSMLLSSVTVCGALFYGPEKSQEVHVRPSYSSASFTVPAPLLSDTKLTLASLEPVVGQGNPASEFPERPLGASQRKDRQSVGRRLTNMRGRSHPERPEPSFAGHGYRRIEIASGPVLRIELAQVKAALPDTSSDLAIADKSSAPQPVRQDEAAPLIVANTAIDDKTELGKPSTDRLVQQIQAVSQPIVQQAQATPPQTTSSQTTLPRTELSGSADVPNSLLRTKPVKSASGDEANQQVRIMAAVQGQNFAAAASAPMRRNLESSGAPEISSHGLAAEGQSRSLSTGSLAENALPARAMSTRKRKVDIDQISSSSQLAYVEQLTRSHSQQRMAVRVDGNEMGTVAFQVTPGRSISVHLGQVLDLFENRFEDARFAQLRNASSAEKFVEISRIADAGISIRYDAVYDELVISDQAG